jgi:hypothetical protein
MNNDPKLIVNESEDTLINEVHTQSIQDSNVGEYQQSVVTRYVAGLLCVRSYFVVFAVSIHDSAV